MGPPHLPLPRWHLKDHLRCRSSGYAQGGSGFKLPSAPPRYKFQLFPLEGAPLGSWNHKACLPPAPAPQRLPVLLLQDEKIQALEELVSVLQEEKGKRLSQRLLGLPWYLPWADAPGHQGSRHPVVGSGQLSPEGQ